MRYYDSEPVAAVPMRRGVEMVFECTTENQVIEVPQTVLPMVYGRGHEAFSFHNREPPLSDPNELEGEHEFQKREKTLEASIQTQYRLDDVDRDAVGYISEMPTIHPLHINRRQRAHLLKSEGNLSKALERTHAAIEEQKRRELQEEQRQRNDKNKEAALVPEPAWDAIQPDGSAEQSRTASEAALEESEETKKANRNSKSKTQESNRARNGKEAKNESKEPQPQPSKVTKERAEEKQRAEGQAKGGRKIGFDQTAKNLSKQKKEAIERKEQEKQVLRKEEEEAQKTKERLLHIINDF